MSHVILPYGDTTGDGAVQLSFTLPVPIGGKAREAARQLCLQMNLENPQVAAMRDLGGGYTFFVIYARATRGVDLDAIHVPEVTAPKWSMQEVDRIVAERLGRPIRVVGACTGSDAHTVGLDAILNMKGFHGDYGLERYQGFRVWNLGSQVPNETLVAKAREVDADAILVSQVVTQKNVHLTNLTGLVDLLEAEGMRDRVLLIAGGPRITHELAVELGFDAGFGPGTVPSQVAAFIVQRLTERA
ncbi:beta-lysine 5,6-aminomutase beta subunit [Symbiobacterium terraclitae]|uniref:Beta-lysine 5,6-aminomutase beta subunit n=1 Tax=Symbiobacterium terraclitae TaxID=557451 RepID=A0ABS4JYF5_9FIRM|nr:beta-lysine 5,6-aminomutase beta subunit [Symbiobacterium terraclitae]